MFKHIREALEAWRKDTPVAEPEPVIPFIDTSTNSSVPSTVKILQVWS